MLFFTEVCITAELIRNMTYENEVPDCNVKFRRIPEEYKIKK